MASEQIQQVLIASEPDPCNLAASAARTPDDTGLTYAGLYCANPEFKGNITIAENQAVRNKGFSYPGIPTLRRGSVAFDLYVMSTGATGSFADKAFDVYDACFGKQWTSDAAYVVSSWDSTTTLTVSDSTNLKVGQGFAFVYSGVKHVRFIKDITGNQITFAPAVSAAVVSAAPAALRGGRTYAIGRDFAADSTLSAELRKEAYTIQCFGLCGESFDLPLTTGEMATARISMLSAYYNPAAAPDTVGSTSEPAGTWLKYLNGELLIDGTSFDVHSCKWSIKFNPRPTVTQANAAGLSGWEMAMPEVTCAVELSAFDDTFAGYVDAGTEIGILAYVGDSNAGSAVAVYCPKMHQTTFPEPTAINDLTALPLALRAGDYTDDTGNYDAAEDTLADTIWRIFFEGGA